METAARVTDGSMIHSRPSILVVEEDPDVVRLLLRILVGVAQDCDVAVLCDAAAVFNYVGSQPVPLVITDYSLPGMTGVRLTAVIKQRWPDTRVVLISGDSTLESQAQAAGVDYYLSKPFPPDALEGIVRMVLA